MFFELESVQRTNNTIIVFRHKKYWKIIKNTHMVQFRGEMWLQVGRMGGLGKKGEEMKRRGKSEGGEWKKRGGEKGRNEKENKKEVGG